MFDNNFEFKKRVAECVGLWLAEGSTKSTSEITFTNNCWDLIDLFYNTINIVFKDYNYNPRIYVYSKNKGKVNISYKNCKVNYYTHKRATKPYFMLRIASVKIVNKWNRIVNEILSERELYPYILRGLFAGEGNIKEASHSSRILRISQKEQKELIDNLLNELKIKFSFTSSNRMYNICGKSNWDIFAKFRLADLHPDKKERFWRIYKEFKEEHYEKNYLSKNIFQILNKPHTTRQLSKIYGRSFARIQDILIELKKQRKIKNFRVGGINYWTNDKLLIIISRLKKDYLLFLTRPRQTSEFANKFKVNWKSSYRRLKELERLNLVKREKDGRWVKIQTKKKILAI